MTDSQRVFVNILDKEYQVACPPSERDALHQAAEELDTRMRTVRNAGTIIGLERIAVMVALNLCHELNKCKKAAGEPVDTGALQRIFDKLEGVLENE